MDRLFELPEKVLSAIDIKDLALMKKDYRKLQQRVDKLQLQLSDEQQINLQLKRALHKETSTKEQLQRYIEQLQSQLLMYEKTNAESEDEQLIKLQAIHRHELREKDKEIQFWRQQVEAIQISKEKDVYTKAALLKEQFKEQDAEIYAAQQQIQSKIE